MLTADVVVLGPAPAGMAAAAAAHSADDEEVFLGDARAMVEQAREQFGVEWDEDLVRLFARDSAETYRVLIERGVRFSRSSRGPSSTASTAWPRWRTVGC